MLVYDNQLIERKEPADFQHQENDRQVQEYFNNLVQQKRCEIAEFERLLSLKKNVLEKLENYERSEFSPCGLIFRQLSSDEMKHGRNFKEDLKIVLIEKLNAYRDARHKREIAVVELNDYINKVENEKRGALEFVHDIRNNIIAKKYKKCNEAFRLIMETERDLKFHISYMLNY